MSERIYNEDYFEQREPSVERVMSDLGLPREAAERIARAIAHNENVYKQWEADEKNEQLELNGHRESIPVTPQDSPATVPPPPKLAREQDSLADLLDDIVTHINRFIGFGSNHAAVAAALWVAHCYVIDSAPMAAYLRVRSAAEESGKSTLLEVLHQLLRSRGINTVSASPSVVFRLREKVGPIALLLDESDNGLAKRQDDSARDLLSIVNSGYRRSATVLRSEGRSFEPRAFRCFGPAVIAGIGYLEPTTESRCIPIVLPRKQRGTLERFLSFKVEPSANRIAERLEAWATPEVVDALRDATPSYPSELRDRHVEVWWNLFTIADIAGEGWPQAARDAALALHVGDDDESSYSSGVLLLAHIRQAFEEEDTDRLPTAQLLDLLASNEQGPWGKWWGAELNRDGPPRAAAADLARKLRGFPKSDTKPIKPVVLKLADGTTARGYHREDFEPSWAAYLGFGLPHVTDVTDVTPLASTVTSVTSVTSPHPNEEQGPPEGDGSPAEIEGNGSLLEGPGSDGCPECFSLWAFGHAEGCSRSLLKEAR
jgi:Protein of unknown function (DUF3631)